MITVYETSIKGHKIAPLKVVTTLTIECALSQELARDLGGEHLYLKNGVLSEFADHGFAHDIDAARVSFFPLPGTPAEKEALLHLPNCSISGFSAQRLDGEGAKVTFSLSTNDYAVPIVEFLVNVRGWSGRLSIEELQTDLPIGVCKCGAPAEDHVGGTGANPDTKCEQFELADTRRKKGLPKPPKKRGRGAQPRPDSETAAAAGDASAGSTAVVDGKVVDVRPTKSGQARLIPRKPKGGAKKAAPKKPGAPHKKK
jgi:hypothetical protein